jgi:hypothetical protein
MSVAERVFGTSRVQSRQEMDEWAAINQIAEENWGWFPALTLVNALGLLLIAFANSGALAGSWGMEALFWAGLLTILLPSAIRLVALDLSRRERITIVTGLGIALYLVKMIHSPFAFTYGDEFLHLFNTNQILNKELLFTANPTLPVSPMFPGLAVVTAALTTLSGLSTFAAAMLVIGTARLVLFLAFYLFIEQVSRSPRVAGLATAFYMCHSNFLFWTAQFAYESLALPLAIGVFYLIMRRESVTEGRHYMALSLLAFVGISAVVITHHLTSYVVAAFLMTWWLAVRVRLPDLIAQWGNTFFSWKNGKLSNEQLSLNLFSFQPGNEAEPSDHQAGPQTLAIFALVTTLAWLVYVAILTFTYLSPLLTKGAFSVFQLILGEGQGRSLFVGTDGYVAPLWERIVGISAIVLSLAALPFGLMQIWRRVQSSAPALLLALAAVGYFGVQGLRLTTASWEMGNRASTYLFIGLAFVLAMATDRLWTEQWQSRQSRAIFAVAFAVIFAGGLIAGWPPRLRVTQPYLVTTGQATIEPQGLAIAQWMRSTLGPGHTVAADEVNGRFILGYGDQHPYVGRFPFVRDILTKPELTLVQLGVMHEWQLDYVVMDRRQTAWDNMAGYFFDRAASAQATQAGWVAPEVYGKYEGLAGVSRVMDSGDVVMYDVGALHNEKFTQ